MDNHVTDASQLISQFQEAIQKFFLHEVQLGEELLSQGDIENGVEHLSMAVAVCGQPHSLLGKNLFL